MQLPVADARAVGRAVTRLALTHRWSLIGTLAMHTLAALAALVPPIVIGRLVAQVSAGTATSASLTLSMAIVLGAAMLQAVLTKFAQQRSVALGEEIIAVLREDLVRDLLRLPLTTVEQAGSGDLLSRTTNDVESLVQSVRFAVPRILIVAITLVITTIATFVLNPAVAAILLLGIPVLIREVRRYLRLSTPGYKRQLATYAGLSGALNETAEGVRTVEAFGLGPIRDDGLDTALQGRLEAELATLRLRTRFFPFAQLSLTIPIVLVIGWGAFLTSAGITNVGTVTTIALLSAQLVGPIGELMAWVNQLQVSAAAMARMIGVGQSEPDLLDSVGRPVDERIVVDEVRYAYRESTDVLHGVDLDLVPGERLAIVGTSGSGKSTLARLLTGVDIPRSGAVAVGGVPLTDLTVEDLRSHVALVAQEHHVFVGTIRDNLRLGRPDADDEAIQEALETVDAWGWASALPDGIDTVVGAGGYPLPASEAQELALARLILLAPATLVLDEATSLLDAKTARSLERSLSGLLEGRTVVAVAHRLQSAQDADRIAVMREGRVTELGSHDELLAQGGEYADLWKAWHSP